MLFKPWKKKFEKHLFPKMQVFSVWITVRDSTEPANFYIPLWRHDFQIDTESLSGKACVVIARNVRKIKVNHILSTLPIPVQKSTGMQNPCVHPAFQQWKAFVVSVLLRFPLLLSDPCWKQMKFNILTNICRLLVCTRVWPETQR